MGSPCFWLFDATIASLIESMVKPDLDLADIRLQSRAARQAKLTKLKTGVMAITRTDSVLT